MKKKYKSMLVYFAILIPVVVSLVLLLVLQPDFFSGEVAELALVKNAGVSCKAWSYFIDIDIADNKRVYGAKTVNFPIYQKYDILSPGSGKTMKMLDTSTYVECTKTTVTVSKLELVGGVVRTSFYGKQENGQWIALKTVERNVSTVPLLVLDKKQIIPSGYITAGEINSKMTSSTEVFSTSVKVVVDANLQFKQYGLVNTGSAFIESIVPIKIYNQVKTPTVSTSNVVDLKTVSPSVFDLKNYKTTPMTVTVLGQLPQWKDSEGVPYVEIFDPTNKSIGKYPMTSKKLISSSTNTYEFQPISLTIPKSPLGIWKIIMHSNGDVRKLSSTIPSTDTMILKTLDSTIITPTPTPTPTPDCITLANSAQQICIGDDEFKSGGVCYQKSLQQCADILNDSISTPHDIPPVDLTASAFLAYKLSFDQGSTDIGTIPEDGSIAVDFTSDSAPLSFVASPKGIEEKLQTVSLIHSIDTKSLKAHISNLVANTKFSMMVDGVEIPDQITLTSSQLKKLGAYSPARDYYLMNQLTLSSADIKQFLSGMDLVDGQMITLQSVTDGTFDVSTVDGMKKGSFSDLIFMYDLRYSSDAVVPPEESPEPSEPCEGLSGESLLQCRGGDPNNCVDNIDIIGDENCNIKEPQTGGDCAGLTPEQCLAQGKTGSDGFTEPGIDLCSVFGFCSNPDGSGSPVIVCPNGSFASKDTGGNQICIDNTTRNPVNPLNSIPNIVNNLDINMIILISVVLLIVLIIVLAKRRIK